MVAPNDNETGHGLIFDTREDLQAKRQRPTRQHKDMILAGDQEQYSTVFPFAKGDHHR
jgi:hypothetical protein